jgi:hypothetical protein
MRMTYRWPGLRCFALLGVLAAAAGCSDVPGMVPPPDGGASASIQFDDGGVLALAPKDTATIDLSAVGLASATLSLTGNYLDAFLDTDAVDLSSGHGQVLLRAPSSPTTFSLLASGSGVAARLDVSVSSTGFASVRVKVDYGGKRAVPIVAASTFVETTCAELATNTSDGSPLKVGTYGETLLIPSVPTDGQVAVWVRIAHYATGCFDVASLTPGETRDVTVPVIDLPLDLAASTLKTRFTFAPDAADAASLQSYFEQVVGGAVLGASFPSTYNEAGELLDAMAAASGDTAAFAAARTQNGWDTTTATWLGQQGTSMHGLAAQFLLEAAQTGVGDLTGELESSPDKPVFTPASVGSLDAATAGVSAPLPFAWSGQANDVLSISGSVSVVPSKLAAAAADARAQADVSGATDVADAMSITIDCAGLGDAIAQGTYAFGSCDGSCVSALCSTALTNLWSAGRTALSKTTDALTLTLSVAAPAQVVDTPQVQSYVGSWVGAFGYATSQIATKGVAKGASGNLPN